MSDDNVRATDAELAEVLRLAAQREADGTIDSIRAATERLREMGPAMAPMFARELMALREQHRAADEALTRCGFPPRGASDTLAERVARLVEAAMTGGGEP